MDNEYKVLEPHEFPPGLIEIPGPPQKLHIKGELPQADFIYLTVVGSRRHSDYGAQACKQLIRGLAGQKVCIVSGLALGIDGIAHRGAIASGLPTVAVPGSGLNKEVLYPKSHLSLAGEILKNGGALISEYEPDFEATPYSFPKRNRVMAGMSQAVLIIEAEAKSGTLITARLALDYNRDVLAVPGSLFSSSGAGVNNLIKQGATPVTSSDDILEALGLEVSTPDEKQEVVNISLDNLSPNEIEIVELLKKNELSREELIQSTNFNISELNTILMTLEIKGLISEQQGKIYLGIK